MNDTYGDFGEDYFSGLDVHDVFAPERKKQERLEKDELDKLIWSVRGVLETESGRRFLWWLIDRGNLFHSGYTGRALDQVHMDGSRMIVAEIFALCMKADPHFLSKMIDEVVNKNKED